MRPPFYPRHLATLLMFSAVAASCKGQSSQSQVHTEAPKTSEVVPRTVEKTRVRPPNEFKHGMQRFKDPGVYVDGKLVSMLRFEELPTTLKPYWHEETRVVPHTADYTGPTRTTVKQRRYSWLDYFEALNIDIDEIREVHLYSGSRFFKLAITTPEQLKKFPKTGFRLGSSIAGKPIGVCKGKAVGGQCPDRIVSVSIFINKKPPIRVDNHMELDGKPVKDIPYHGPPVRGGIRVYVDNRVATVIKRRQLTDDSLKVNGKWHLLSVLEAQGVSLDGVVEAWLIEGPERKHKLVGDKLLRAGFVASPQRSGRILVGDDEISTQVIALHTSPVKTSDLPTLSKKERAWLEETVGLESGSN